MTTPRRIVLSLALAATLGSLLGGCIVVPAGRPYGYGYGGGEAVMVAPPSVQAEVVGVAPGPGYFWIGGFWNWIGGRHVWTGGHWEGHRQGYQWAPHQWHREGNGWRAAPGHWERR